MSESMKQENLEVTQSETRTCGFSNYSVCQGMVRLKRKSLRRKDSGGSDDLF